MGCVPSSRSANAGQKIPLLKKPSPWQCNPPINLSRLRKMRQEFWETRIEGRQVMWETLKAVAETGDDELRNSIVQSAGITVPNGDLTECYDELGYKYELPNYILTDPTNLIQE